MAKRKKKKTIYNYTCTLTGETFTTTKEASNPDELVSVKGYYELHPEDDDRPEAIKLTLTEEEPEE